MKRTNLSGWVLIISVALALLFSTGVGAQTVTIGATDFPLGENAFPNDSECLDTTGCGSEDYNLVDFLDPLLRPVSPANALRGYRLDLVALDLDNTDEIRLSFPAPIVNQDGNDIYFGQAEFINALADLQGINDVQIRFPTSMVWHTIGSSQFAEDTSAGFIIVTYADPELKQDAYSLWFAKQDLSSFGFAPGASISEFYIRGVPNASGSGLDTALVGNLNAPSPTNQAPVADAGPDQTVLVGDTVTLDGSGSSDVDGNSLTFSWSFTSVPAGSGATLSDPTAVMPTFVSDVAGDYVAQLIVNDGFIDSAPDTVRITANPIPIPVDTFTVVVKDTRGVAIPGARVAVNHPGVASQITDADGQATFTLPAGGTYLYTIEAPGYVTQEVSSGNTVVDVTLDKIDATISGIVEDTNGGPLVGATVTAFQPDEIAMTYQAVSDAGGDYSINLPMGAPNSGYTVVAEREGYVSVKQTNRVAGIVDFTGSNGLQPKTTITSVTAAVVGTGVRLDITADPAFSAVTEADVTVTSVGTTGFLGPLSLAGDTISVTYSTVEDFTVAITADTSEDHYPDVGYFASSTFGYVADDPATASARMDVDAGGGTLNLTANGQTSTVVVPVGGVSKPATFVIKQIPKTVQTSYTEGSPTYVYEVTAVDSNTGTPLTTAEIIRIELTLPIDLNIVQPGDLEDGVYVIYQAADTATLETGDGMPVPASQIISTDYGGDGVVGSVRIRVDHLSAFGAGASAAAAPSGSSGGGGGGGCFITAAYGLTLEPSDAMRPARLAIAGAFTALPAVGLIP